MPDSTDRVDRWHRNVARGSKLYADVNRRRLDAFARQMKTSPEALVDFSKEKLRRLVEDFLDEESKKGRSGEYVRTTLKALRSWLSYNEKELPSGLKVPNERSHPRVEREEPVTPDQLRKAILAANPGQRVVLGLMAFSGVRPQVLGSYDGSDGIRVRDFPELKVKGGHVEFDKIPTLVKVRPTASKAGHGYFTFLGAEGCEYLKQHLEARAIGGEVLGGETDVVSPSKFGKKFMTTINVGDRARQALRAAGIEARPYALRAYFFSRCLEAANAGKTSDRYVEFWAGHTGDVTSRHYTTGRPNLPTSMIEDMRAAYKRCEPFLSTTPISETNDGATRVLRALLVARGHPKEEAEKLDIGGMSDAELEGLFKKLGASASGTPTRRAERAVLVSDVPALLEGGWEFVSRLDERQAVLREPPAPPGEGFQAVRMSGPVSGPR